MTRAKRVLPAACAVPAVGALSLVVAIRVTFPLFLIARERRLAAVAA